MKTRTSVSILALGATLTLLVSGCGGGDSSTTPSSSSDNSSGSGNTSSSTSSSSSSSSSGSSSSSSSSGSSSSSSSSGANIPEVSAYIGDFLAAFDENMEATRMESWSFNLHDLRLTQTTSPGAGVRRYQWTGSAPVRYSYLPMGCTDILAQVPGTLVLDVFVSGPYAGRYWWNWVTSSGTSVKVTCMNAPMDFTVQPPNLSSSCQSATPATGHTYSSLSKIDGITSCPTGTSGVTFGHDAKVTFTAD